MWKSPSRLSMSSKSDPGVLEDRMIPDTTKIAFNRFRNVFWTVSASFMNICCEKVHQDSLCLQSLTLESWRTGCSWHDVWHVRCQLKLYHVTSIFWNNFQTILRPLGCSNHEIPYLHNSIFGLQKMGCSSATKQFQKFFIM